MMPIFLDETWTTSTVPEVVNEEAGRSRRGAARDRRHQLGGGRSDALIGGLIGALFGNLSPVSRAVYLLVGVAALYQALHWKAIQQRWQPAFAK